MADKDDYEDDGYQFTDPDSMDNPQINPEDAPVEENYQTDYVEDDTLNINPSEAEERAKLAAMDRGSNKVLRNALIAVGLFILAVIIYALWPYFFAKKVEEPQPTPVELVEQPIEPIQPIEPPVQTLPSPPVVPAVNTALEEKISQLELNQQSLRSDVNALNNQLSGVNSNINNLNAEMMKLNKTMADLATLVTEQAQTITILTAKLEKPAKPSPPPKKRFYTPPPVYYLNAIVPGRAWLIANNGATLTVRVGSSVPGYGIVKVIDAQQGRVLTGSGRIIRFSQDDS